MRACSTNHTSHRPEPEARAHSLRARANGLLLSDKLIVNTGGGGVDTVLLDSVTVNRRTKIVTGWGEDEVTIRDSIFTRKVILEGGLDDDTLHLLGLNNFNKGLDEDFEL